MIQLSEVAQSEIKKLLSLEKPASFLRVSVKGGGCSGLSYDVKFEQEQKESDHVFQIGDVKIVCDSRSLLYLDGMTVDFSRELVGGGFRFINPNASGSCGCGTSFSV